MEVTLDYGNGSVEIIPLPFNETLNLVRQYMKHANYTICVSDRNQISYHPNTCTKLIVQKPLLNITLECLTAGNIDNGEITCQLVIMNGTSPPGEVFGLWKFTESDMYRRYLPKLFLGDLETETHTFNSSYIGTHPLFVTLTNLISTLGLNTTFTFQKTIRNISLETDKNFTTPGSCIQLIINIGSGSHLQFYVDFGNNKGSKLISYRDIKPTIPDVQQDVIEYELNTTVSLTVGTCASCYGGTYNEWLGYVHQLKVQLCYREQGDFIPGVVVSNGLGNAFIALPYALEIAIPLDGGLQLFIPAFVPKPDAIMSVEFKVVPGKVFAGKITCNWHYESNVFNVSNIYVINGSAEVLLSLNTLPVGKICGQVECQNALSSQTIPFCTVIEEQIQNVTIAIIDSTLGIGDDAHFEIRVEKGTYQGSITFDDGQVEDIPLQAHENFTIVHQYGNAGYFMAQLKIWNNFSDAQAAANVTVQPIISQVAIGGPSGVAIGFKDTIFVIGTHNLTDVMYTWQVSGIENNYAANASYRDNHSYDVQCDKIGYLNVFVKVKNFISEANSSKQLFCAESLGVVEIKAISNGIETNVTNKVLKDSNTEFCVSVSTDNSGVTHTWYVNGCENDYSTTLNISTQCLSFPFTKLQCVYNLTLEVANPVGKKIINMEVEVLETVSMGPIKLLSPCIPNMKLVMVLELYHDATRPCYSIDYGDGSQKTFVGIGCDIGLVTVREDVALLSESNITFGHDYTDLGVYYLTVIGYNDVSLNEQTIKIPVNAEPCKQVDISILGSGQNPNLPRKEYKSVTISLVSSVIIDCNSSAKVIYSWTIEDNSTGNSVSLNGLDTEKFYLDIPESFLQYGAYKINLEAFLSGMFGTDNRDTIHITIVPSPLQVSEQADVRLSCFISQLWSSTTLNSVASI